MEKNGYRIYKDSVSLKDNKIIVVSSSTKEIRPNDEANYKQIHGEVIEQYNYDIEKYEKESKKRVTQNKMLLTAVPVIGLLSLSSVLDGNVALLSTLLGTGIVLGGICKDENDRNKNLRRLISYREELKKIKYEDFNSDKEILLPKELIRKTLKKTK